ILLHWVSALVIIWVLLSGFYVAHLSVTPTTFHLVAFVNVAMTTLFIPIFLLRWLLRRTLFKPGSLEGAARGERIAHLVHEGLYWTTAIVL
ncbi:hypothetical protein, partial [Stenotrophomonas maltophilia]